MENKFCTVKKGIEKIISDLELDIIRKGNSGSDAYNKGFIRGLSLTKSKLKTLLRKEN